MVKGKGSKKKDAPAPAVDGAAEGPMPTSQHVQRKVVKKQKFYDKLMSGPKNLSATKSIKKHKRKPKQLKGGDLSSLLDSLPGGAGAAMAGAAHGKMKLAAQPKVLTSRMKSKITTSETSRIQQVLGHPQFQQSPAEAIRSHLAAILPPPPEPGSEPQGGGVGGGAGGGGKKALDAEAKRRQRKVQKLRRQMDKEMEAAGGGGGGGAARMVG